jgi:hypothetical protein
MTLERLVNLLEILQVYAHLFVEKATRINISMDKLGIVSIWDDPEHRINLVNELQGLQELCITGELPVTKLRLDHIVHCFGVP